MPTAKVVMLTTSVEEDDLFNALRAGASGYLLKASALDDMAASIRVAASGQSILSPALAAKLVSEFDRPASRPEPCLTERETEVLRMVAEGCANRETLSACSCPITRSSNRQHPGQAPAADPTRRGAVRRPSSWTRPGAKRQA